MNKNFRNLIRAKRDPRFLLTRPLTTSNTEQPFIPSKYSVLEEGVPAEGAEGAEGTGGAIPAPGAFEQMASGMKGMGIEEDPTQAELPSLGEFRQQMQGKQKKLLNKGGL